VTGVERSDVVAAKAVVVFRDTLIIDVLDEVELDGVEADDLELRTALVTRDMIALLAFGVDKNILAAFRAN
jgi:hypothetical protein